MGKGPLEWNDDLLTGDREIDAHHRTFFRKALRLSVACQLGRGPEFVHETFVFLREYAEFHFAAEEKRMRAIAYPHVETHIEAHRTFLARLGELALKLKSEQDLDRVAKSASEMAVSWFNKHINLVDRPLVEYLRQHEVHASADDDD